MEEKLTTLDHQAEEDTKVTDIPREYVEFTFVKETATGRGRNEKFVMENLHNGNMKITEGRIGITVGRYKPRVSIRPYSEWDQVYMAKISKSYIATKTKKMDKVEVRKGTSSENSYAAIPDLKVSVFVNELLSFAKHVFETSYTVKVDNISEEMIALGRKILDELQSGYDKMSVAEFNNKLKLLYAVIPRRMDKLSKHLAKHKLDFPGMLSDEQDLFDIMVSQVRDNGEEKQNKKTILDANNLTMRSVTKEEEQYLKQLLKDNASKYIEAFRVSNAQTEQDFNAFAEKFGLSDGKENGICHLFHGTRHENVWSIMTTGLKNRPPKDVVTTGKAYGMGTYFAPDAIKSLGYTSRAGAKWTAGGQSYGLLFVCKVATGKPETYYDAHLGCDSSLNAEKLALIAPGALCTWAGTKTSGFRMDEVIVYQNAQSTIEYVIKVGA